MAIGILLKLDKLAYLELNVRMAISYKLVACLLLLICLGGCLDLCLSIQVLHYPKVSNWNISSTMLVQSPCGHLATKSGCLSIFHVCMSNCLASHLFPIDWTSSISCSCRATPGGVKTLWKKEVLHLIDQMEDCFDRPFEFNPEAIESARRTRGASAVEPGQWGYGINVYGKCRNIRPRLQRRAPWMLLCMGSGQMRNIPGCRHTSTVMVVIS